MKKSAILGIVVIMALLDAYFIFIHPEGKVKENDRHPVKTVDRFIEALTEYDLETAKSLSVGTILANLTNTNRIEEKSSKHMVISKTINVVSENKDWAKLNAEVETEDRKTGVIDMHWYELYLVFENKKNWRVYRIDEVEVSPGEEQDVNPQDKAETTKIFGRYLTLLSKDKYDKAGELLVGKARTAHEQAKAILGTSPVIKHFKEIKLDSFYFDGKVLMAEARYLVDGRRTVLAVSFFRTSEGWRIFHVSQI